MSTPSVSIVVPWRDRPELGAMLDANRELLPSDAQWIVVNGGGDRQDLKRQIGNHDAQVVHLPMRSWAKGPVQNVGVALAKSEVVFLLDTDIALDGDCWTEMSAALTDTTVVTMAKVADDRRAEPTASPLTRIANSTQLTIEGRDISVETSRYWPAEGARSGPGVALVRAAHFRQVGGIVGSILGGLFLDIDMLIRLGLQGIERVEAGSGAHIDPDPEPQGSGRARKDAANFLACLSRYEQGLFQGSYEHDSNYWMGVAHIESPLGAV